MEAIKVNINSRINPTSLNRMMSKKKIFLTSFQTKPLKGKESFQKLQPLKKIFLQRIFIDINQ